MTDSEAHDFDAAVLRFLSVTPGIERWQDTRLPTEIERWLAAADDDELLSAIAAALQQLNRRNAA